jgi:hypothetical protein
MSATLKLGMTHHPTAHLVFQHMKKITQHLKETIKNGPSHVASIIEPMQAKYDK